MKETQTTNNQNKEEYMERIKSLLVSALLAMVSAHVSAQADGTFQWIDTDGNTVYADPTGIDEVLTDNGDTTINVYDASGKTVMTNRPASALMSLGKGLYICETMKDGKRVAVRKIVK